MVVALGGNALLRRGEPLEAANQMHAAQEAAARLVRVAEGCELVITHGNGPQVGLLSLMSENYRDVAPYPLDVLGAETEGQIGYVLERELTNAGSNTRTVALLTRVLVDAEDPAFVTPTKFIGPVYSERDARAIAQEHGWAVKRDGSRWRRVVPSPEPKAIVELDAIACLVDAGFLVVCAGGGGVPVINGTPRTQRGIEAVVDKDLASALLARGLGADVLVLATDVDAVYDGYGTPEQQALGRVTPGQLREQNFADGSMGPKVEAACRFVEQTGGRGVIGRLQDLDALIQGSAGTQITSVSLMKTNQEGGPKNGIAA